MPWLIFWLMVTEVFLVVLVPKISSDRMGKDGRLTSVRTYRHPCTLLIVQADNVQWRQELRAPGAYRLTDHSVELSQVDAQALNRIASLEPSLELGDVFNVIWLWHGLLNTVQGEPVVAKTHQQPVTAEPRLHLIQFIGPVKNEGWKS
jgi:hypothetical protein